MSFQLKLMVAMVGLVVLVSWVVLGVTERRVEVAYAAMYEERYEGQIEAFLQMREGRVAFMEGICERAAGSERMVEFVKMKGGKRTGLEGVREELLGFFEGLTRGVNAAVKRMPMRSRERGGKAGPGGVQVPLVCVIRGEGEVVPVSGLKEGGERDRLARIREAAMKGTFEEQGVLYVAVDLPDGGRGVREVVVTPVVDPASGERLGALLVGADPKSVGGGKLVNRISQSKRGREPILNGMVLNGEFFGDTSGWGESAAVVSGEILDGVEGGEGGAVHGDGETGRHGSFVTGDGQGRMRVHYQLLNEESEFAKAFHVAVYSLGPLDEELTGLRRLVLGAGGGGLVLAVLLAFLLAKRLTVPVRELSTGTAAVARGELDVRVPVRGGDELGRLAGSFNEMAEGLAMKERYRSVLGKVADVAVAEALVAGELELGGEEIEVTVLFCDIRGFTAMSEGRKPSEVIGLLNEHMTAMTEVVYAHRGVVDKFVGNACRCAMAMVEARRRLNETARVPVDVGIGVATGVVVAGCMGSEERLNYTVVGERVNLAARLCGVARAGDVVVDGETWGRVEGVEGVEERVGLKGFSEEVGVWRLGGGAEMLKS